MTSRESVPILCGVEGEVVEVDITIRNPLTVELKLKNMSLLCLYESEGVEDAFDVEEIDELTLRPSEKKRVSLKMTPRRDGNFRITGIQWRLQDQVNGQHKFPIPPSIPGQQPPPDPLKITVDCPQPHLDIKFMNPPDELLEGEVCDIKVQVSNTGPMPMRSLRVCVNDPSMVFWSKKQVGILETTTSAVWEEEKLCNGLETISEFYDGIGVVDMLPLGDGLKQGESIQFFLRVHGNTATRGPPSEHIGTRHLKMCFLYDGQQPSQRTPFRLQYKQLKFELIRSLDISSEIIPSSKKIGTHLLNVKFANLTRTGVVLESIATLSNTYQVEPVHKDDSVFSLEGTETSSSFLRLVDLSPSEQQVAKQVTYASVEYAKSTSTPRRKTALEGTRTPLEEVLSFSSRSTWAERIDEGRAWLKISGHKQTIYEKLEKGFNTETISPQPLSFHGEVLLCVNFVERITARRGQIFQRLSLGNAPVRVRAFSQAFLHKGGEVFESSRHLQRITRPKGFYNVHASMEYEHTVTHNFAVDALCEVPVTLTVRNSNKEKEVRVELNTDPRFARAFQRGSKSSSHNGDNVLMWLGPSKCVLTIPPRSDQIVNLTLCASCYGQHMLNGTIFLTPLYDDDDAQFDSDENDDNLLFFDTHEYLEVFQIDA
uniref:Uncharacterized protein n=1 Tax=Palpitomonas bilix TaxID=652834 RepID=A0A7S3FYG9_9EUKA